jgi:hypothetical protein
MRTAVITCVMTAALCSAEVARADSFSLAGTISTSGIFFCRGSELACSGSGTGTLTLGSGSNTATLRFEGVDRELTITNRARPVVLGQFVVEGPSDFTFPERLNDNPPIINFDFSLSHTTPVLDTNVNRLGFGPGGNPSLRFLQGATHTSFSLAGVDLGPGFNYSRILYSLNLNPFFISGNGTTDLTADVGVVPEPATIFLVGAGLAGAIARRRRKASKETVGDTLPA